MPVSVCENQLPDRDGIKELVGDYNRAGAPGVVRPDLHRSQLLMPVDRRGNVLQGLCLAPAQCGVAFDQVNAGSIDEARHDASGADGIAHERASPRTELDQINRARRPHCTPGNGGPDADQLAKDLADLRGGREVAGRADDGPAAIVAVLGVVKAGAHVGFDGDRTLAPNAFREVHCEPGLLPLAGHQAPAAVLILASRMKYSPSRIMGME